MPKIHGHRFEVQGNHQVFKLMLGLHEIGLVVYDTAIGQSSISLVMFLDDWLECIQTLPREKIIARVVESVTADVLRQQRLPLLMTELGPDCKPKAGPGTLRPATINWQVTGGLAGQTEIRNPISLCVAMTTPIGDTSRTMGYYRLLETETGLMLTLIRPDFVPPVQAYPQPIMDAASVRLGLAQLGESGLQRALACALEHAISQWKDALPEDFKITLDQSHLRT